MDRLPHLPSHTPVMPDEVMTWLAPLAGETVVDGTVGLGGHARMLLKAVQPGGRLIGMDRDPEALAVAMGHLGQTSDLVTLVQEKFSNMQPVLARLGVHEAERILLDLGVSSLQLDRPERGFSFSKPGPLDMRMDPSQVTTAAHLVASLREQELADLFYEFGEERNARRIARSIVESRANETINTTERLAEIVRRSVRGRGRIHPATRIFQALRIAVNDELEELDRGLAAARDVLAVGGRLVVLTFHSLEDRRVKNVFRAWAATGEFTLVRKRVIKPSRAECQANRRARSAKLRVIERSPRKEHGCD